MIHKFKVGDKVEFISENSPNAQFFRGKLSNLEICEVDSGGYCYMVYTEDKKNMWGVDENELKLMIPKEITDWREEFK